MRYSLLILLGCLLCSTAHASAWLGRFEDAPDLHAPSTAAAIGQWQPTSIQAKIVGIDENGTAAPLTPGLLRFQGAITLTSKNDRFGGLSGFRFTKDGQGLVTVSDRGTIFRAATKFNSDGALIDLYGVQYATMQRYNGELLKGMAADAESLELSHDGLAIIGFERYHRIDLYRPDDHGNYKFYKRALPNRIVAGLSSNGSMESVALLPDDRLITIAETSPDEDSSILPGWMSAPNVWRQGTDDWQGFRYVAADDYHVSDMVFSQDDDQGDYLYLLERSYSKLKGVRIRVTRIAYNDLIPGTEVIPEEVARLNALHGIDNMEAMDIRRLPDGRLMLYILSDDNFSLTQRTILQSWEITEKK
ncbi:MAG: esterase-like activity of phytase family protein [bacterium]